MSAARGRAAALLALALAAVAVAPSPARAGDLDALPAWLFGPYPDDGRIYAPGVSLDAKDAAAAETEARAMAAALLAFQSGAEVTVRTEWTASATLRGREEVDGAAREAAEIVARAAAPDPDKVELVKRWTSGPRVAVLLAARRATAPPSGHGWVLLRGLGEVRRAGAADQKQAWTFLPSPGRSLGAAARAVLADLGLALAERALVRSAKVDSLTMSRSDGDGNGPVEAECRALGEERVTVKIVGLTRGPGGAGSELGVRLAPIGTQATRPRAPDDRAWEHFTSGPCPGGPDEGAVCALGIYEGPASEFGTLLAASHARCSIAEAVLSSVHSAVSGDSSDSVSMSSEPLVGTRIVRTRRDDVTGEVRVLVAAPARAKVRPVSTPSR